MKVYVAVNLDLGWDNVIGVFDSYEKAYDVCRPAPEDLEDPEDAEWYLSRVNERTGMYELHHIHTKEVQ
jgi:hypothetical protein